MVFRFIINHWPKIGILTAVLILVIVSFYKTTVTKESLISWLSVSVLMAHQFEEYAWPGGFQNWFNNEVSFKNPFIRNYLSIIGILLVNVAGGWSIYLLAAFYAPVLIWLTMGLLLVHIANGLLHTGMAIYRHKYNPGAFTGFFLNIPFGIYGLIIIKPITEHTDWYNAAICALIIFFFMITTINLSGVKQLPAKKPKTNDNK